MKRTVWALAPQKKYTHWSFNEKNLKQLLDKREDDRTNFVVKDEVSTASKAVTTVNIQETCKLFLKPFDYLFNAGYLTLEMKAYYRQEAIDQGLLKTPGETVTMPSSTPPKGAYL